MVNFRKKKYFCKKGLVLGDPPPPGLVKDHTFTFFFGPFPYPFAISIFGDLYNLSLREGSKKKCKSMVFYQIGGGHPKPNSYCKIFFLLKLTICPQTYPIHKEIVISAVLVINSLCGDHFLIA